MFEQRLTMNSTINALVTGGAGFIGSHLVDRLLADGAAVTVLDNFSTGKHENLVPHDKLQVVAGDVGDYATVERLAQGMTWIFHEAAVASVPATIDDPVGSHQTNYVGTLNVLEAARKHRVQRVMFAASAAAYGDLPEIPKTETMAVKPLSPYAVDKLASEYICRVYHQLYGVETVCLRYFNVFGPRQDPSSPYSGVISVFTDRVSKGQAPTIFGDGEQTRDFVYVADVVAANIQAATVAGIGGETFNIANQRQTSLNELLRQVCAVYGKNLQPGYDAPRAGDIKHSLADTGKARNILQWQPKVGLQQGLQALIDSLRGA